MNKLGDMLGDIDTEQPHAQNPLEYNARVSIIGRLFLLFNENSTMRAEAYAEETLDIPLHWLKLAVRSVCSSHVWKNLPTVGEIHHAARELAGLNREQYTGRGYIAAPQTWPPAGHRHGAFPHTLEEFRPGAVALPSGERKKQLTTGGDAA